MAINILEDMLPRSNWRSFRKYPMPAPEIFHIYAARFDEHLNQHVASPVATLVVLDYDDHYVVGTYVLPEGRNFSKKIAREVALGRAQKAYILSKYFLPDERPCLPDGRPYKVRLLPRTVIDSAVARLMDHAPRSKGGIARVKYRVARLSSIDMMMPIGPNMKSNGRLNGTLYAAPIKERRAIEQESLD